MYLSRNTTRQKVLLEQDKRVFRTSDLAVLWRISNKNSLLTTIKRYVKKQILYRLVRGVYSTVPLNNLHPYEIGCAVAGPLAYVTAETVLAIEGVINQQPAKIVLASKKGAEFTVAGKDYWCRYLNPKLLVDRSGITDTGRFCVASKKRAINDLKHFNPKYHFN